VASLGENPWKRGSRHVASSVSGSASSVRFLTRTSKFFSLSSSSFRSLVDLTSFFHHKAESGNVWASPNHRNQAGSNAPPGYSAFYQSPTQSSHPFSVVVDPHGGGHGRQQDIFDPITAPPQAYSTANATRYAPYSMQLQSQQAGGGGFDSSIPFDGYGSNDSQARNHSNEQLISASANYQSLQPFQLNSSTSHQPSYYSSSGSMSSNPINSPVIMSAMQQQQQQQANLLQQQREREALSKSMGDIWPNR
jgi:hypothetical protein